MKLNRKAKIMVGAAALLAAAGGGVSVAASQNGSPSEESQAVIDDAAKPEQMAADRFRGRTGMRMVRRSSTKLACP